MTSLFKDIVFGPIQSRRLGKSLGINTLPLNNKICNFNCIYCECGWTDLKKISKKFFPKDLIVKAIENKFSIIGGEIGQLDSITFAGNGEPTMHPDFPELMDSVIELRNRYLPGVSIAVLSNASLIGNKEVVEALLRADRRIMKLDAGTDEVFRAIDQPLSRKPLSWYIDKLCVLKEKVHVQTMFLRGEYKGVLIDNTQRDEINSWLAALKKIKPLGVMIYSIDRPTPVRGIHKIEREELLKIGEEVKAIGIPVEVY